MGFNGAIRIESALIDLSTLDTMAGGDSPIHRLDPRIKVLTAAMFVVCVVSFDKYVLGAMLPFVLFLVLVAGIAGIPLGFILRKLVLVSPFALLLALFNPLFDQQPMISFGSLVISGGWISFASIMLRFTLTVGAMLVLVAVTGFNSVCMALERLGMPRIFAVQLLLLYRYIFVLMDEGVRVYRARELRSFQGRGLEMRTFGHLIGGLLLRTLDRAQRIHLAMLCRGFDGTIRTRRPLKLRAQQILWFVLCCGLLFVLRRYDLSLIIGRLLTGLIT
jgi:cobalt/nickel transport system permease protein